MESSLETRPPTPRGTPHAYETRRSKPRHATYPTTAVLTSDRTHKGRRDVKVRRRGPQGTTRLKGRVLRKRRVINSIETRREGQETNAGREIQGNGAPQDSKPPHDARFGMRAIARWGGSHFNGRNGRRAARREEVEPPKPRRPPHEVGNNYHRPPA